MKNKCSICGCHYRSTHVFKNGRVCEHCLEYVQESFPISGEDPS